jgi:MOSC domain-containing protein YiiM
MRLLSVNVGVPRENPWKQAGRTGIDKHPVAGPVLVTAPGAKGDGGVGLDGDHAYDVENHGGPDQAVYAYAREDLDDWQAELGPLRNGFFGENLTTAGVDVNGALIGERWRIGTGVLLEVSCPRIPCSTFRGWVGRPGWLKRFTSAAKPGAYLRVVEPGTITAGDRVTVEYRPGHNATVALTFRALTLDPDLLPQLAGIDAMPEDIRALARARAARPGPAPFSPGQ